MTRPVPMRARLNADSAPLTTAARVETDLRDATAPDGEPVQFPAEAAHVLDRIPERTALLCVTSDHRDGHSFFKLTWYFDGEPDQTRNSEIHFYTRPDETVADVMRGQAWKKSYQRLAMWWRDKLRVTDWLERLVASPGEADDAPVRLVVLDLTDFQIPWELHYSDRSQRWLGAEIEVMRWPTILDFSRWARFAARTGTCTGGVLALETPDIAERTGSALSELLQPYRSAPVGNVIALLTELSDKTRHVGLVMLRCHGAYEANDGDFCLGGENIGTYEIDYGMPLLERSPAVVLLNACDSGTPKPAGPNSFVATQSFAELFLRRGAYSVIATLGPISIDYSHDFAYELLDSYDREQRIAEILLRRRRRAAAKVARRIPDTREDADYDDFFQSFGYVYFGHPDTTLRLALPESGGPR
ncbi:CHAT domain-containing protein [Actinoplanes hulinensis]|uniref:CHAT domain-containing protein n=1 Tax=Actinoplanes hulinensis TaxID=1144547 RepID=A0ABS7AXR7_9ACTN|nr:CHAT domain-containing protein [Actinoplanes hulinensis]MBW6433555.1 CHAT domain-containing protein [Actinoplanes hulinensis]